MFPPRALIVDLSRGATSEHLGQLSAQLRWHQTEHPDRDGQEDDGRDRQDTQGPSAD